MKLITLLLSISVLTLSAVSKGSDDNDLANDRYLTRVYAKRSFGFSSCLNDVESILAQLPTDKNAVLGGPSGIITSSSDQVSCDTQFVVASTGPLDQMTFSISLSSKGFKILEWVGNETAVYMGYVGTGLRADGSFLDCTRKNADNDPTANWYQSFIAGDAYLNKLANSSVANRKQWIQDNFDCGPVDKLKGVDVSFDLTNQTNCPLSVSNLKSCFILRGLSEVQIDVIK